MKDPTQIMKQKPEYDLKKLVGDITQDKNNIIIKKDAIIGAKEFKLLNENEVRDFLTQEHIEEKHFRDSQIHRKKYHNEDIECWVDAYDVQIGNKLAYIAFYYFQKIKKWILKSFKKSHKQLTPTLTSQPFAKLTLKQEDQNENKK